MSWTANSCLVTVAILFLWRVQEMAEACSCSPAHPQQAFCNSDVGKSVCLTERQWSVSSLPLSFCLGARGRKKVKMLRGEKVAPLSVFTVTGGGKRRRRRVEFSVSLSLFSSTSLYSLQLSLLVIFILSSDLDVCLIVF